MTFLIRDPRSREIFYNFDRFVFRYEEWNGYTKYLDTRV